MNKMIFNLLVLFFSSVNYSCNRQQIIEETTRDERSHDIITKQDILMSLLNDSSLVLNTSLKDYTDLVNLSPGFFLFVSEENCLSCVDSVMEYLEKKCSSDINIKVDTVHGVKGETHTATLYLETWYKNSTDIKRIINYLTSKKKKIKPILETSLKVAYVGMTRPTCLLCVAAHKDTIYGNEKYLQEAGWEIREVKNEN